MVANRCSLVNPEPQILWTSPRSLRSCRSAMFHDDGHLGPDAVPEVQEVDGGLAPPRLFTEFREAAGP
jgi:hypothetical protein